MFAAIIRPHEIFTNCNIYINTTSSRVCCAAAVAIFLMNCLFPVFMLNWSAVNWFVREVSPDLKVYVLGNDAYTNLDHALKPFHKFYRSSLALIATYGLLTIVQSISLYGNLRSANSCTHKTFLLDAYAVLLKYWIEMLNQMELEYENGMSARVSNLNIVKSSSRWPLLAERRKTRRRWIQRNEFLQ